MNKNIAFQTCLMEKKLLPAFLFFNYSCLSLSLFLVNGVAVEFAVFKHSTTPKAIITTPIYTDYVPLSLIQTLTFTSILGSLFFHVTFDSLTFSSQTVITKQPPSPGTSCLFTNLKILIQVTRHWIEILHFKWSSPLAVKKKLPCILQKNIVSVMLQLCECSDGWIYFAAHVNTWKAKNDVIWACKCNLLGCCWLIHF